jgi:hypothetical protein
MTPEQRRIYQAGQALHRDGASPAGALDLLAAIIEDATWERATDKDGRSFAGRFRDFVTDRTHGLNTTPAELVKVIGLRHPRESKHDVAERVESMRVEVGRLLKEEIKKAGQRGRPGKDSTTVIRPDRETAGATIARLKRDDPVLAERVVNGEMSAYAAARSKGWKPPRIQVTTPERTAVHLRKYMSPDDLALLAKLITEG